ncbi:hypothetical protein MJG53_020189 [Ovis ammon polii x Ovis aries]|uniref:Uncharacterized protein n=1 Tax=Ovis ammon polii x Ovis aries TaxID=2918886 RepID=A0ACB9U1X0_9CETA|nr:hypothetical protein MJG53_020189 [Ovis ammon polii x Ovis aries]
MMFLRRVTPASTFAATASSNTMLFIPFSDSSTCTAATGPSFGAPVTSAGMFGDTSLGFGLSFSGAYGAAAVASSKTLQLLGCIWMLIGNVTTITALHGEVEKVKLDQKRLEQELDFILSQQKELEDLLIPLEESLKDHSVSVYPQYIDEHEKTYKLAENVDAQMKQMTQDLKDITEYLNIFESPADSTDPLQWICRILNVHLDCLQWINHTSDMLQRKVEEVTQILEDHHWEEYNVKMAFD